MNLDGIPAELQALPQWVCWGIAGTKPGDKEYKKPYNPATGRPAKAGVAETWAPFKTAVDGVVKEYYAGVGFEFAEGGGIVGVDFDHCFKGGQLVPWAAAWVERFGSYTEISPSGEGLHILCKGRLPGGGVKRPHVEMYDQGRYFTVTGRSYGPTRPLQGAQEAIEELYRELSDKSVDKPTAGAVVVSLSDQRIIEVASKAKNGDRFQRLFSGDWRGLYQSQSEADCALCNMLAFYTGKDTARMDRLFRASGLMREKWDEKHGKATYGSITIADACKRVGDSFGAAGDYAPVTVPRGEAAPEDRKVCLETFSARELQDADLPPVIYVVKNLLTAGLALLVSPPKYGKSWMVLDLCLAIAAGLPFLGYETEQGECLYLALEDSKHRLQDRMNKVLKGERAPMGFDYAVSASDLDNGLINQLEDYLTKNPKTKLVVIDTLQKVRGSVNSKESAYSADYRAMGMFKTFADKHGICILLVHHLRKMKDEGDPFNMISGTNAILGAADTAMVLTREKRSDDNTKFSVIGRDVESSDSILRFDKADFRWKSLGDANWLEEQRAQLEYQNNPIVKTIKKLLEQNPAGWSGSMSELMEAGKYIARTYLAESTRALTNKVKALDKPLFDYDGIVHSRAKHGSGGGKHHFYFSTVHTVDGNEAHTEGDQSEIDGFSTV